MRFLNLICATLESSLQVIKTKSHKVLVFVKDSVQKTTGAIAKREQRHPFWTFFTKMQHEI